MNNYNFGELLSSLRFEQLTRDLLQKQYGNFENFAEGRDGGIDFRYSLSVNYILIVQCKKYKDVRTLISNLKKECIKAQNLKFSDYILVVSLNLTDKNKEEILTLYKGKIQNPSQIITNSDLNSLLSLAQNQNIEFKYAELWMKSVNIHQKIFHLGFLKHSEFIKNSLEDVLKKFVPYKEYYQIIEHFNSNNVAIITGDPGIGKTTLSYAIISNFIYFKSFQLIDISYRTIKDAEAYIYSEEPAIFFIDDFLGKIKVEKDNDYTQLLSYFILKIEKSRNKKLIITSREYILRKASKDLFSIEESYNHIYKYVIELNSFSRRIRTEILYNHIHNSELDTSFIDEFLHNDFKKIIDHKNYNPRIIEHLTNAKLLKNIKAENYYSFFIENLNKPAKIWENVYNNLPNDLYKLIIITRFIITEQLPIEKFENAIMNFIEKSDKFKQYSYDDFEYIIKELEGTFFKFQTGYDEQVEEEYRIIEFQNPSIIDYIDSFIWSKTHWLNLIIKNAIYFEQLFNSDLLEVVSKNKMLIIAFRDKIINEFDIISNACFGYFEYETNDEGSFSCWIPERYNYYLAQLTDLIDIKKDTEFANFIKKQIFKYTFDGAEDISEKISFSEVATILLEMELIDSSSAIKHYTSGFLNDIKELVYLEYMTRLCTKESLSIIRKNIELVKDADNLFLYEIERIENKDFIQLIDFFDDYTQIKNILPLK